MSEEKNPGTRRELSPAQFNHVFMVRQEADRLITNRYRDGALEHGSNLFDQPEKYLLDAAIEEAIDQVVYLLTLKQKLQGLFRADPQPRGPDPTREPAP